MPDLWVDVDTAVILPVNILPIVDSTDGKTIEDAVAYDGIASGGMELVWNFMPCSGTVLATAVTPTTGSNQDWVETVANRGMYSIEMPASGGAHINNDTEGCGWFTGEIVGALPFRGPTIGFRAAGLNNALIESAYSATRGLAGTAVPDAAANAAGGLPISTAGTLDLDTKLANTNEVTAARMGALTDWINGGRLDLILDIIAADTTTDIPGLLATVQADLDTITGTAGALIATDAQDLSATLSVNTKTITAGAIAAAAFSANAIDATALAANAATEIAAAVLAADPTTATVGAAPNSLAKYIQGLWNRGFKKRTATATVETAYETDGITTMETWTLDDDDTTAQRTP